MLFMDESLAPNNSVIPHGRISLQAVNYETPRGRPGGSDLCERGVRVYDLPGRPKWGFRNSQLQAAQGGVRGIIHLY